MATEALLAFESLEKSINVHLIDGYERTKQMGCGDNDARLLRGPGMNFWLVTHKDNQMFERITAGKLRLMALVCQDSELLNSTLV